MIILLRRRRWHHHHHHHHHHHRKRYSRSPRGVSRKGAKNPPRRKKKERRPPRFWKERKTERYSLFFFFRVSSSSASSSLKSSKSRALEEVRSTICGPFLLLLSKKTREIFFFLFFFCGWEVSFDVKHTRNNNETTSPFFIFVVKVRFPFLRVRVCVHFRVSNYVSFFFQERSAFCVHFRSKKERRKNTCMYPHFKTPPPLTSRTTQNVKEKEEEERHVGRTPVRAASHAQGTTPTPRATCACAVCFRRVFCSSFFLLSLNACRRRFHHHHHHFCACLGSKSTTIG